MQAIQIEGRVRAVGESDLSAKITVPDKVWSIVPNHSDDEIKPWQFGAWCCWMVGGWALFVTLANMLQAFKISSWILHSLLKVTNQVMSSTWKSFVKAFWPLYHISHLFYHFHKDPTLYFERDIPFKGKWLW